MSVKKWLDELRSITDEYDSSAFCACARDPQPSRANRDASKRHAISDLTSLTRHGILFDSDESLDTHAQSADSPDGSLFYESCDEDRDALYVNIWECRAIHFATTCTLSPRHFDEEVVEELYIEPVVVKRFVFWPNDIIQWHSDLVFDCCGEDEMEQEYTSLEKIQEERRNQFQRFPVDDIEIRHKNHPHHLRNQDNRSVTVHGITPSLLQHQLKVVIQGVTKVTWLHHTRKLKNQLCYVYDNRITIQNHHERDEEEETLIATALVANVKLAGKKQLLLHDTNDAIICKLHFEQPFDAQQACVELGAILRATRAPSPSPPIGNVEERHVIRHKLLKLLGKRSSKDILERKGIIRNEPIFGNTLANLYERSGMAIPPFVARIIDIIERPTNLCSVGLYRTSGNLAVIQKIRFHIDKNELKILEENDRDIDVLTGTLKLFFRELKEPLMLFDHFQQLCTLLEKPRMAKHDEKVVKIIETLPEPHKQTLLKLFDHLLNVERHYQENKMDIRNLSRVWGPTLIWSPADHHENLLQIHNSANRVIESLLHVYKRQREASRDTLPDDSLKKKALLMELTENLTSLRQDIREDDVTDLKREPVYDFERLCSYTKDGVPEFVSKVIACIERNINTDSLYQKAGNTIKSDKILKRVTKINVNSLEKQNVHDLTWTLRRFFAQLNTDPIPSDLLHEQFVPILRLHDRIAQLLETRRCYNALPRPHKATLDLLLPHLVNVTRHHADPATNYVDVIAHAWTPLLCPTLSHRDGVALVRLLLQIADNRTVIKLDSEETGAPVLPPLPPIKKPVGSVPEASRSFYENCTPIWRPRDQREEDARGLGRRRGEGSGRNWHVERLTKL